LAIAVPQVILAIALAAGLGALPGQDRSSLANAYGDSDSSRLDLGECVRKGGTDVGYLQVACSDHRAFGRVIALADGDDEATESCAPDTDFFATQPHPSDESPSPEAAHETSAPIASRTPTGTPLPDTTTQPLATAAAPRLQMACLRRLDDVHPGDPGEGGGVYRAGDCVAGDTGPDAGVREVPCSSPTVFERVTARAKTVAECGSDAYRFAALAHGSSRILCLGDGDGIASPGECMGNPNVTPVTFAAVECGTPGARARVLARVANPPDCRRIPRQTHYVEDPSGLPPTRVVCLAVPA
jgi:hypothetical protein